MVCKYEGSCRFLWRELTFLSRRATPGSEKAEAAAQAKHNAKPHGTSAQLAKARIGKKNSTDDQQAQDAKKL
jgi:hypothetical protein